MPATTEAKFTCSACGKEYRWKPELAGKQAKCKCGKVINIPSKPPAAPKAKAEQDMDLDGLYALAAEENKAAPVEDAGGYRCPSCSSPMPAGATVCPSCHLDVRTGRRQSAPGAAGIAAAAAGYASATPTARAGVLAYGGGADTSNAARASRDVIWEGGKARALYMPLGLIVLGILFYFGEFAMSKNKLSMGLIIAFVGIRVIIDCVLIFCAMLIAVKGFDMGFGAFGPAILKVVAIAMGPGALAGMLGEMVGGGVNGAMVGGAVQLVMYYGLIQLLFNLDLGETLILSFLIYAVQNWVGTFILVALMGLATSGAISTGGAVAVAGGAAVVTSANPAANEKYPPVQPMPPEEIAYHLDQNTLLVYRLESGGEDAEGFLNREEGHAFINMTKDESKGIVQALKDRGAPTVNAIYFANSPTGSKAGGLYVELPKEKDKRAKIFEWREGFLKKYGMTSEMVLVEEGGPPDAKLKREPLHDWGQEYLIIHFNSRSGAAAAGIGGGNGDDGDEETMDEEDEDGNGKAAKPAPAKPAPAAPAQPDAGKKSGEAPAPAAEPAPF